ncbi:MAG TPA: hypothetical protein VGR28_14170 [Candidatus Thermoplasmatota archaeon]|nr:hypothetical protein [Candidatus Thermoplasmatota archaeon]
MRAAFALLLVAALAGVATAHPSFEHDQADPPRDVERRLGPATAEIVDRPGLDVLRLQVALRDGLVVQTTTLAAPLEEGATLNLHDELGRARALTIAYEHNALLPPDERLTATYAEAGRGHRPVAANATMDGALVRVLLALADLPADATCFEAAAVTLAVEDGPDGQATLSDVLEHPEHRCEADAPAPSALAALGAAAAAATLRARRRI